MTAPPTSATHTFLCDGTTTSKPSLPCSLAVLIQLMRVCFCLLRGAFHTVVLANLLELRCVHLFEAAFIFCQRSRFCGCRGRHRYCCRPPRCGGKPVPTISSNNGSVNNLKQVHSSSSQTTSINIPTNLSTYSSHVTTPLITHVTAPRELSQFVPVQAI